MLDEVIGIQSLFQDSQCLGYSDSWGGLLHQLRARTKTSLKSCLPRTLKEGGSDNVGRCWLIFGFGGKQKC